MVAFSRLQLAAALLEYDNDPDGLNPPKRAEDSAIFSHIRTHDGPRARTLTGFEHVQETPNLLGVELPNDVVSTRGSLDVRRSIANTARMSRVSMDMLRNPFGGDDVAEAESEKGAEEEGYQEEELEVDLEAWGMADFFGNKETNKEKLRAERRAHRISKAQSETIPNYHPAPTTDEFGRLKRPGHLLQGMRSKSMGGMEGLPEEIRTIRGNIIATEGDFRRRTLSGPLDIMGRQTPTFGRPLSSAGLNKGLQVHGSPRDTPRGPSPLQVPFPTSPPDQDEEYRSTFELLSGASTSRFDPRFSRLRTMSDGVSESNMMLGYDRTQQSEFSQDDASGALSDRASRFDPRPSHNARPLSGVSIGGTLGETQAFADDNPFSLPPPSQTNASRFDPKAMVYTRTMSDASLGSRLPPDFDRTSVASGQMREEPRKPRPLSRLELLRPKVLIMPSPLQEIEEASVPPPPDVPVGFQVSSVGLPLPPGAKSNRPVSQFPLPSNTTSLTPNPRLSLSLAQLTFRNSLMTGGQRDPSFVDIEQNLRRAQQDGEQIYQEDNIEEEIAEEQKQAQGRAPGKLYGRSLMDELEARKEKMRSKQRVFTGDQRPLMMSRGQIRRSSTLIDPDSLQEGPSSQAFNNNNNRPGLTRKVSSGSGPLLSFGNENAPTSGDGRDAKSVFGVDQLWERELAKLKEIEAIEKAEKEERRKEEEEKTAKKAKKATHKNAQKQPQLVQGREPEESAPRLSRLSELPPTLPDIPTAARRAPAPMDYDSETDSEASEIEAKAKIRQQKSEAQGWVSSDDEDKPKPIQSPASNDSEDDVPLARVLRNSSLREPSQDSEDEQPLAKVLERKSAFIPNIDFNNLHANDDEDDTPLGLKHPRASAFLTQSTAGADEEDDDKPLALKQLQRRQPPPQFNFMAQQPMMMMQPQMTGSMVFPHQSMMSGFSPFMMGPAFNIPPPQSVADSTFASVDRWRRDVTAD